MRLAGFFCVRNRGARGGIHGSAVSWGGVHKYSSQSNTPETKVYSYVTSPGKKFSICSTPKKFPLAKTNVYSYPNPTPQ